ncbi:hypothetical protein BS78_05G187700 [Paspalum vaginatum]|nr:hypothetical protein BS78_05G187700 [Paspalum vaginatum]
MRALPLSWNDVAHVVDHLVLGHIPSFYDRCRIRCVSHRWCDATRLHPLPRRPLPLVINGDFTILNCFADGQFSAARAIKLPAEVLDDQRTACVGSLDDRIVCVYPRPWDASQSLMLSDQHCYVLDPSRQEVAYLPDPPAFQTSRRLNGSIQVENDDSVISYTQPSSPLEMTLKRRGRYLIALSMTTMSSWCFCSAGFITVGTDLEFYEDSLYLLVNENTDLYVLDFGPQFCFFLVLIRAERCLIDQLPNFNDIGVHTCNLVQLNKKLLLVVRQFPDVRAQMTEVLVYMLYNKTKPWKWVNTSTLDGYCILISSAHNKSYPAYLYDEVEEETIYFLDSMTPEYLPREGQQFTYRVLVYNMKNKTIDVRMIGRKPSTTETKFPMWFCPTQ